MIGKSVFQSFPCSQRPLYSGHDTLHLPRVPYSPHIPLHAPLQSNGTGASTSAPKQKRKALPLQLQCVKSASAQDASTTSQPTCVEPQNAESLQNPEVSGPGVYEVFDESGKLQYVGVSKQMALSLAGHAQALSPQLVHRARCSPVPSGRKADLQQAWKAAIVANGSLPPGNAKGETTWAQKPAQAAAGTPQSSPASSSGTSHPVQAPVQGAVQAGGRFAAAAAAAAAASAKGGQPARPNLEQLRASTAASSHPAADAAVTQACVHQLCTQGFFVVDGVADPSLVASAQQGAESLRSVGLMMPVSQQRDMGRLDEILVLNEQQGSCLVVSGPKSAEPAVQRALTTPESVSLAKLAALLKGIPQSIMQHAPSAIEKSRDSRQQQQQQQQKEIGLQSLGSPSADEGQLQNDTNRKSGSNSSSSSSGETVWLPPEMAVPQSLMLAVYPGQETYYARHKDNDDSYQVPSADYQNNPAWAGPPGQRVRDRAITSILYLNKDWDADRDGGCLRLFHTDGGGGQFSDIAPESGRLVVFQACAVEHEVLPSFRQRWAMTAWVPTLKSFQE